MFTEKNLERQLLRDKLEADGIEAGPAWGRLQQGHDVVLEDGRLTHCDDYTQIARKPRKVIVAGDNDQPDLLLEASTNVQVVIHEATYTQEVSDRVGPWPQHSSAAQVARFAEAAGVPHLVLTHFSSRYQLNPNAYPHIGEIESEARGIYRGNLYLAKDFACYELGRDLILRPSERL